MKMSRREKKGIVAHILIVSEEPAFRRDIRGTLESGGHEVSEAVNGRAGLERVHERHPDIVVTDIVMPHKCGIEFTAEIKRASPETRVIAIANGGRANRDLVRLAGRAGASLTMARPFPINSLLAQVERLLGATPEPPPVKTA